MSWTDLDPPVARKGDPVTVSMVRGAFVVTLRPDLFPAPRPDWLVDGAKLGVQLGQGENTGRLRLVSGGPYTLAVSKFGRVAPGKPRPLSLRLHGLTWITKDPRKAQAVETDDGAGWLEITLPLWACRNATDAASAATAPAPRLGSLSSPQDTQVAALRQLNRSRTLPAACDENTRSRAR